MSCYKKLLSIQNELKAPKNQYNSFGKYNYRSCEDIQEGLKPLLFQYGATIIISDEIVVIGNRHYVKATVEFVDIDTGEAIKNTAYAREEETKKGMDGSQVTGASSSYARKYALNGLFCIDDTKDVDTNEHAENEKNRQIGQMKQTSNTSTPKVDKKQLEMIFESEIKRTGKSLKFFLDQAKASEVKYIKTEKLQEFIQILKTCVSKDDKGCNSPEK